jgi:hypothetical protein
MKSQCSKTVVACALLLCGAATNAADPEPGTDDLGVDFYQQNDFYAVTLNKPESTAHFYERQVEWMMQNRYPPASIILSSVNRGMTLADTVFFMSKAQPEQAGNIYALAVDMMPSLPGWACSAASGMPNRYDRAINPHELPAVTLEAISRLYFEQGKRFMKYPKWEQNQGNAYITLDELIHFKEREIEASGQDSWWYRPDGRVKTDVLMVSLYPSGQRVVIDARLEQLREMKQGGALTAPVMLLYTEDSQFPMSDLNRDPDEIAPGNGNTVASGAASAPSKRDGNPYVDYSDDEISASEVIARFGATGQRVSPTRDWHRGDHHLQVKVEELQSLFDIPAREDVPVADWRRWEEQLAQGLEKPLLISLYEGAGDDRWLDEAGLVAVAADKKIDRLPVVFFYHSNQRQACGLPAACADQLREAIVKGSGRDDLFTDEDSVSRPPPLPVPLPVPNPPVASPS